MYYYGNALFLMIGAIFFGFLLPPSVSICEINDHVNQVDYHILSACPHDSQSYTQGLVYLPHEDLLLESSGLYYESNLRKSNISTGAIIQRIELSPLIFAEGIALIPDSNETILLTWKKRQVLVYDLSSLAFLGSFQNPKSQGWGLTSDGNFLIMSDGSSQLYFLHPHNFTIHHTLDILVPHSSTPCSYLNELEYIDGQIWANVYLTDLIVIIDPSSGVVTNYLDLGALQRPPEADFLNGIAFLSTTKTIVVTGKLWDHLFLLDIDFDDLATSASQSLNAQKNFLKFNILLVVVTFLTSYLLL